MVSSAPYERSWYAAVNVESFGLRSAIRNVCSWSGVASWLIWRLRFAATTVVPSPSLNRQRLRTTNGNPTNRPAESFASADARRFIAVTAEAESDAENDSVE